MTFRALAVGLSTVVLAATAAGCAKDEPTATGGDAGFNVVNEGTLTICTHLPYEPFEFTEGGEVVGFDIDVLKIAAESEGLDHEVVDIGWETIVSGEALNTGQCDVAAGAMSITDEREAVMDFTDQYFEAKQALLMKADAGYESLDDLAGKKIAVQDATTGADFTRENAPDDAEIVSFEDSSLMQQAVKTGKVDAGINDNGLLNYFASQNPDVEVGAEFETGDVYGFSVKKDSNDALLDVINDAIASDDYDAAYEKWFGEAPAE